MSPRVAQLAYAHSFVFFALGVKFGPLKERQLALRMTMEGAPLGEVAATMGIPMSFRNLPPEACDRVPVPVRWSAGANRLLAPHIPGDPVLASDWLNTINFAHAACDEKFALWVARHRQLIEDVRLSQQELIALAVFAWYSQAQAQAQAQAVPAVRGAETQWTSKLGIKKAFARARTWGLFLGLVVEMEPEGLRDPWIMECEVDGYRFVPLLTPEDVLEEAIAMRNCLVSYGESMGRDHCRIFSIRRGRTRVANLEIRFFQKRGVLEIVQLKGVQNTACPAEARAAAQRWIRTNGKQVPRRRQEAPQLRKQRAEALLAPYLDAKQPVLRRLGPVNWQSVQQGLAELSPYNRVQLLVGDRQARMAWQRERLRRAAA
jgi:hypothetical protein